MDTFVTSERACLHCGTPFAPQVATDRFCCAGCAFVHDLIDREGLGKFYDLKGDERLLPAGAAVLLPASTGWVADVMAAAEARAVNGLAEVRLDLQGISCMGCVWLIEAIFQKQPGAGRLMVNAQRGEITVSWLAGQCDLAAFVEQVTHFGYTLAPWTGRADLTGASGLRLGLAGGLAMNAMAFTLPRYLGMDHGFALAGVFELVAAFSATISLLACGSYFIGRAWGALRLGRLHLDVPIAAGIVAAWGGSVVGWLSGHDRLLYFDFVATFIFLMLLGRRLQESSVARHRSRLLHADPLLHTVSVFRGEDRSARPVAEIRRGLEIAVPPAGVVPVNAELRTSKASLSLEWINGEAEPRTWDAGAVVPAGAVNLSRDEIRLHTREDWNESLLARLSAPAEESGDDPATRWLDKVLRGYLAVVLGLAAAGAAGWWMKTGDWSRALQVLISVLVVSCPCALGVAVPMAHELAVARLRRRGLFVRRPDVWGRLRHVRRLVFDKTGTLTLETPRLENASQLATLQPTARAALQALVQDSRHPLAASLRQALVGQSGGGVRPMNPAPAVHEIPGLGVHFTDAVGAVWSLGRPDWTPADPGENKRPPVTASGGVDPGTIGTSPPVDAIFRCDGVTVAAFRFAEAARTDAAAELAHLRHLGFSLDILSGDRFEKVQALAVAVGIPIEHARSRLSPEDKALWIMTHAPNALFIGDGANDSLAFDAALVRGTPAIERGLLAGKADFYFLSPGLRPIRELFAVARARRRAVHHAIAFALAYNLCVVALSLAGHMSPLLAAILMPLSSAVTLVIVSAHLGGWGRNAAVPPNTRPASS